MNLTMIKPGAQSPAPSRTRPKFRRSLTPTLALLAAMALGLMAPVAAEAQLIPSFNATGVGGGGGGGGGEGGGTIKAPGAGGDGGSKGTPLAGDDGQDASGAAGGAGGNGATGIGGGQGGSGKPGLGLNGGNGGVGGDSIYNISSGVYDAVTITGGTGGKGGITGGSDGNFDGGNGGMGGKGGDVILYGASGSATTIHHNLTLNKGLSPAQGANQAASGGGGFAIMRHEGTLIFNSLINATHDIGINGGSYALINNLQIVGGFSGRPTSTVNLEIDPASNASFNTISLINGGIFNVNTAADWSPLPSSGDYVFNNLYITGTGNQLNLDSASSGNTLKYTPSVVNGHLTFAIDNTAVGNATMLTVGDINSGSGGSGMDLNGFNVNNLHIIGGTGYYQNLRVGDRITLIDNVDNAAAFATAQRQTIYKGGLRFEDFFISATSQTNGDLVASYGGKAASVLSGEAFEPYFQGQTASMHMVTGGSRQAMDQATRILATTETSVGQPLVNLTAIGSDTTLDTGSSVDVESYGGILTIGTKMNNEAGVSTVAVFGEFGTGSYSTYKNIPDLTAFNNGRFKGVGDTDYYGGGIYVNHLFDATQFAGGFSLDGSLRGGTVSNKFNLDMLDRSGYDIDRNYIAGHIGLNFNHLLTNMDSLDTFGQLHFARVAGGDFNTSAGERISFDQGKSNVSRLGARYNHSFNETIKGYATGAWEYEFDGSSGGSVDRIRIRKAPDVGGSSGFGQLGLNVKSAANPVSLDASVFGVTGQQEGFGGTLGLRLDF